MRTRTHIHTFCGLVEALITPTQCRLSGDLTYMSITTCWSIASHLALRMGSQCLSQTTLLKTNGVRYVNSIDMAPQ